ncbi:glycosyltransferase [Kibdelosporangium persicum]|uniref:Glycosyltransferase involved in cell wall biosynthesis n=1 Tax=Kibdelosporangium persicum TaxID=2698649 RepID=A0ABX2F465_9PSEU|nr:glycosyltransferase [Kibdelosporangium persicum]NRN65954.1 Glycosyltransferase involved in cell wall biosynthesis [Kibdelosporangium persicum]
MIVLAVFLAVVAACCFAISVAMQHGAVQETGFSLRVLRSRRWLIGTSLAVLGAGLHVVALWLAPLVIVQPIGVLSLLLTVVLNGRGNVLALIAVGVGTAGFVLVAASTGADMSGVQTGSIQTFVLGALAFACVAVLVRNCLLLAGSAAVLFGLGAAVIRAATAEFSILLGAESALLILLGGWLVHQAYAVGSTAVVVGSTTVLDPFTAVAVGLWVYGEAALFSPVQAIALAVFALLSVAGVIVLARTPEPEETTMLAKDNRLRILIGADTFPPDINGAANFAGRLAHGLADRGHDVHVACPQHAVPVEDTAITMHPLTSKKTPFHPTFRISLPWQAAREAEALIRRVQPDIVHVQSHFPVGRAVLRAARRHGIPVIATNHFMPENLLGYVRIPRPLRAAAIRWAWRDLVKVFQAAQLVTAPTPRAVDLLTANGLPGSPRAISCGIDLGHYPARQTNGKQVLFVGRLDEEKNVHELIRAVARLPEIRAEIVGDGACRAKLTALAESLGVSDRVEFRGFVSDEELVRAYQRADLFCMPGTAELQSLATMEAMAAGLPVVVADAMALPHLVEPGVNGFRYPPGNVALLAVAIDEVFRDPSVTAAMGEASREMIAVHDIGRTLATFEDVYYRAAGITRQSLPVSVVRSAA